METEVSISKQSKKMKVTTDGIRVKKETKKKILADVAALNRKEFGSKITPDEYVAMALSLLKPEHLEELKTRSLTNKDRLELKYQEFCAAHGKVSKDEFLGALLEGRAQGGLNRVSKPS